MNEWQQRLSSATPEERDNGYIFLWKHPYLGKVVIFLNNDPEG